MIMASVMGSIWGSIKELQSSDRESARKMSDVEVLIAGTYVKRDEFTHAFTTVSNSLSRIEDKLDRKVDK